MLAKYLQFFISFFCIGSKIFFFNADAQPCDAETLFRRLSVNCLPTENYLYCVLFEVGDKEDARGNTLRHIWFMGDGNIKPGASVEHCYNKYGNYEVKLVSSKVVDGIVYSDTTVYLLDVGEIALIQEIKEDQFQYFFDGSGAYISEQYTIKNYYWDFGDGNFGCNILERNRYIRPGEYEVKLMVEGVSATGETKTICGSKKITVR